MPLAQPITLTALMLLPSVFTRIRRRSVSTKFYLLAALVTGVLGGVVAVLLQLRGVDPQVSALTAVLLAGGSLLAGIGITTLFFGVPWRQRRRPRPLT